jgi:hypothetical protein
LASVSYLLYSLSVIERTCLGCASLFRISKPSRQQYCSQKCRLATKQQRFKKANPNYWTSWENANREKRRAQNRRLYSLDKTKHIERSKQWHAANPNYRREYKRRNREAINAANRNYYALNIEQIRLYQKAWRMKNADKLRALAKVYRERDIAKTRAQTREYHRKHPHWKRASEARRRAKKKGVTPEQHKQVLEFYRHVSLAEVIECVWCNKNIPKGLRHVDHIVPLSRGGLHRRDNLCCACFDCNVRKRDKLPDEWLKEIGKPLDYLASVIAESITPESAET